MAAGSPGAGPPRGDGGAPGPPQRGPRRRTVWSGRADGPQRGPRRRTVSSRRADGPQRGPRRRTVSSGRADETYPGAGGAPGGPPAPGGRRVAVGNGPPGEGVGRRRPRGRPRRRGVGGVRRGGSRPRVARGADPADRDGVGGRGGARLAPPRTLGVSLPPVSHSACYSGRYPPLCVTGLAYPGRLS